MDRVRRILEFILPSTATGFLVWGWFGALMVAFLGGVVSAVTGTGWLSFLVSLAIWIPLWIRATKFRAKQKKIAGFLNDLQNAVEEKEKKADGDTQPTEKF